MLGDVFFCAGVVLVCFRKRRMRVVELKRFIFF